MYILYIYIQIHTYVADQGPKILEFGTTTVNLLLTLAPRFQGETPCWKLVQKFGSEARTWLHWALSEMYMVSGKNKVVYHLHTDIVESTVDSILSLYIYIIIAKYDHFWYYYTIIDIYYWCKWHIYSRQYTIIGIYYTIYHISFEMHIIWNILSLIFIILSFH